MHSNVLYTSDLHLPSWCGGGGGGGGEGESWVDQGVPQDYTHNVTCYPDVYSLGQASPASCDPRTYKRWGARKGNVGPASVASKTFMPTNDPCGTPNATEKVLISKTISKRLFWGRSKNFIDELKKFQSCKYLGKYNSLLGVTVDFVLHLTSI